MKRSESNKARNVDRMNFHDYIQFSSLVSAFLSVLGFFYFVSLISHRKSRLASHYNPRLGGRLEKPETARRDETVDD
jgi:hypothetical protein